jgi:thiosulfate dehydrogenase [quinone] large subunit
VISDPAALPAQQLLGRALLPLRAFLGFTFCFAGLQKLANPRFFDAADPASVQSQLAGAARLSPIHALIAPLVHLAVPLGILIACGELAIGTCTLLGLWSRLAAAGGLALSLMLFLTVSFHATPYYTGSDIVFVFAWTPLLLAGPGSVLSLDAAIPAWVARRARDEETGPRSWPAAEEASRREVTLKAVATVGAAAAAMIAAGVAAGWGRLAGGTAGTTAGVHTRALTPGRHGTPRPTAKPGTHAPGTPQATARPGKHQGKDNGKGQAGHPPGAAIGPASGVPVGLAASCQDPATGEPSIVSRPRAGKFLAFDAVCPHAGCTVAYDPAAKLFACPCHGSEFSASTGAVERGPAATGLRNIAIAEGSDGQLYAT